MKDNFDLKKFLVENKTIENSNPFLKEDARTDAEEEGYLDGMKDEKEDLKSKIREMIVNELTNVSPDPESIDDEESYYPTNQDANEYFEKEEEERYVDKGETSTNYLDYSGEDQSDLDDIGAESGFLEEAKEDEEEEEVEAEEEEVTDEEGGEEEEIDVESEEEIDVETGGGLEDIAADMEGNEGDLMDHLISALKVSKGMDNDKLTTQIGNTLKFFVGEYIGGEE